MNTFPCPAGALGGVRVGSSVFPGWGSSYSEFCVCRQQGLSSVAQKHCVELKEVTGKGRAKFWLGCYLLCCWFPRSWNKPWWVSRVVLVFCLSPVSAVSAEGEWNFFIKLLEVDGRGKKVICSFQAGFIPVGILTSQEKLSKKSTALRCCSSGGNNRHAAHTRVRSTWLLTPEW